MSAGAPRQGSVCGPAVPVVHVVSRGRLMAGTLGRGLDGAAEVRQWTSGRVPRAALDDLLILDLADLPTGLAPHCLVRPSADGAVWLVVGEAPTDSGWLEIASELRLPVVRCDARARADGFGPLVSALRRRLAGVTVAEPIAPAVLERAPSLLPVADLVRVICEEPWGTRRPRDLARSTGVSHAVLRRRCLAMGFSRVEHLIVAVRALACDELVRRRGLSCARARRTMGIQDRSNHRRQLERARRGSAAALAALRPLVLACALILAQLAAAGCRDAAPARADDPPGGSARLDTAIALPVVGDVVRRGDLVLTIRTTGRVRAERQVSLRAEAQGTVAEVGVRSGERVSAGQVLVRLDPRPFDLALREAEAGLADARVRLGDLLLGDNPSDTGAVATTRRENARLRSGIVGAQARYERARLEREQATIPTPFGGTMDQVYVVVGQRVSPGDAIAAVVDLGSAYVEAAVLEHDLALIRPGASARIHMPGVAEPLAGRVATVLPLVDTTARAGRALVHVSGGAALLRPGTYAEVELESSRLPARVLVPAAAVIERDGRPLVFRYHNGHAEWVYVSPGRSNERDTEILPDSASGRVAVAPGDTVLVEGHLTLTHDAPVRVALKQGRER